jgi:hypothetical protein
MSQFPQILIKDQATTLKPFVSEHQYRKTSLDQI